MSDNEIIYSISEVSERLGVSYRTLHYYEDKFDLAINRDGAGNRIYTEPNVELLEMIFELKKKGMSLDGIKAVLKEKGLINNIDSSKLIVIDPRSMELRDYLLTEIKSSISQELQTTNAKLDQVLRDNQDLREELLKLQRQSEDHYSKIDKQLTEWRNKQPWYKKFFSK